MLSRRRFLKAAGLGVAATAMAGSMAGCATGANKTPASDAGASASSQTDNRQVIVSMSTGSEPAAGFDPIIAWGDGEHVHEPLIQSTLITTNTDLEFVNDLATSYECAEDGMSWTFHIRDDVRFTDGEPLSASDVAFTLNSIIESEQSQADLTMVKRAVAEDATTVRLEMARPNNALLYTLAVVGIVPEHAYGPDYGSHPIGSGRYMLEQWDRGQQVILVANPDYYGDSANIERVVVVFMEEDASLAAAQAGQVDVAYTSATLAGSVPLGYDLFVCATVDSRGISLPCVASGAPGKVVEGDMVYEVGNDVTSSISIRRALNYGIDRRVMIDHVLNGYGTEAWSVSDGMPWSSPDMKVDVDTQRAIAILEEDGWVAGTDGIREKDGLRAAFVLYYAANDSVRQALAADFAAQAKGLGIEVEIRGADWSEIYSREYSDPVLWGWGSNSPVELFELTYSGGWGNYSSYENAEVDSQLLAAQATPAIEQSYPLYRAAQWDPATQTGVAPQGASTWVWLANVDHLYFARAGLSIAEQKPHPHGHGWSLVNNIDKWSWA